MKTYYIFFLAVLFLMQCSEKKINPENGEILFEELIDVTDVYTIKGSESQPVFTFGKPVKIDSSLFFPERVTNSIFEYSLDGVLISKFGGEGKGPGDLKDPLNISVTINKTLVVNEIGNLRFQEFDMKGNSISSAYLPSFSYMSFTDKSEPKLVWAVYPQRIGEKNTLFHLVNLIDDTIIKNIGSYDESKILLHGWVADHNDMKLYVANVLDQEIKVFDKKNERANTININSINTNFFDINKSSNQVETEQNLMESLKRLNNEEYTSLAGIFVEDDLIIVLFKRNNYDENIAEYFIDIYDINGVLKYSGIDLLGELVRINVNELAVVNSQDEGNGIITIQQINFIN